MSANQDFIEARQNAYYQAMSSGARGENGAVDKILNLMSKDVKYSDIYVSNFYLPRLSTKLPGM